MYKNKFLIALVVAVLFVSCKDSNNLVDQILATVERGAIIRTISTEGASWNVTDETETITLRLEAQDEEDGRLLKEVRFYVDLVDNTSGNTVDPAEVLLKTSPASEWEDDEFGLPRTTFSTSLGEVAAALGGLNLGDYNCGDQFNIRLELELTDGRMWTAGESSGTVSGGSFFSSPLNYRVDLIVLLPSDTLYTGSYQLTQTVPGIFGVSDYADGVYQIDAIDNVTRVIRSITTFPAFGGFGPVDVEFKFVCNEIILTAGQSVGAGCSAAIQSGPAVINATFDPVNPDDSAFDINFTSDETDDCGTGTAQATVNMVKQ